MKMVSQLTRQAMTRHRLISTDASLTTTTFPHSDVQILNVSPTQSAVLPDGSLPLEMTSVRATPVPARIVPPPRPQGIYAQLMKSHDRMNKRHIHT